MWANVIWCRLHSHIRTRQLASRCCCITPAGAEWVPVRAVRPVCFYAGDLVFSTSSLSRYRCIVDVVKSSHSLTKRRTYRSLASIIKFDWFNLSTNFFFWIVLKKRKTESKYKIKLQMPSLHRRLGVLPLFARIINVHSLSSSSEIKSYKFQTD